MTDRNPDITFTVTAEDLDEAAQFAVDQLKDLTATQGHRGFEMPELVSEFYLADPWRRCFEFRGVFIPATT